MFEVFGRKETQQTRNYDVSRVIDEGADAAQFSFTVGNEVRQPQEVQKIMPSTTLKDFMEVLASTRLARLLHDN